jgi:chemotaxis response regulator CheB
MDSSKIRIAVLDSNPKSRKHLVKLLGKEDDFKVVAETGTDLAGIREVEEYKPDVILVEDKEPFTDRIENTSLVVAKFPNTKVIVLSIDQRRTSLPLHLTHTMTASSCQTWTCYSLCEDCTDKEILAAIRDGQQPK